MQKYISCSCPLLKFAGTVTNFVISNPYENDALFSFFARKYFKCTAEFFQETFLLRRFVPTLTASVL